MDNSNKSSLILSDKLDDLSNSLQSIKNLLYSVVNRVSELEDEGVVTHGNDSDVVKYTPVSDRINVAGGSSGSGTTVVKLDIVSQIDSFTYYALYYNLDDIYTPVNICIAKLFVELVDVLPEDATVFGYDSTLTDGNLKIFYFDIPRWL